MVSISVKHQWLSGWGVAPAPIEYIIAKQFPMLYIVKPVKAMELVSKVENPTIVDIANDLPKYLIKMGKACELRSKWS